MAQNRVKGNRRLSSGWINTIEFLERPYIRFGVAPLFLLGIPTLFFFYYTEEFVKNLVIKHDTSGYIVTFLDDYSVLVFVISILLLYLYNALPNIVSYFKDSISKLTVPMLLTLKECLEQVVISKADRFNTEVSKCKDKPLEDGEIFNAITNPKQQLIALTYALYEFLNGIADDIDFKVRIVQINDNTPVGWISHAPQHKPPHTDISVLQRADSAVNACLNSRSLEVIDDIEKEASKPRDSRYVMGHTNVDDEKGSLLCYPVAHSTTDCYPYVITVSADKPYFREKEKELYRWILDQFALRIRLEHSLLILKED